MYSDLPLTIVPHEHVRFCDSILGLAGFIRSLLVEPRTLDELCTIVAQKGAEWPGRPSFSQIALAVTLLFAIGQVTLVNEDRIGLRQ